MSYFIILGKYTDQGIRNIKESPKRGENTRRMVEQAGGKMQLFYTLGEYDFITIIDVPNDEVIMKVLLWLGSLGNIRTKTLKAWSESEGKDIISKLP